MPMSFEPGFPAPVGFIPLSVPEIRGNEWKYIKECLDTGWVSSGGPFIDRFERDLATYVNVKYAVSTVNGTAAIHTALLVAGIMPDDEVLVPDLTFIAPANAVRYIGAWPVFIDVEPFYWQMDPDKVGSFLEEECSWINGQMRDKATGRRVKAILPVHVLGHPVNMDPIVEMARKYNLVVIEDATESLGAKYKGQMLGNLGDISCFSFNGNKVITTGGGGMIVTDNEDWARHAKYLTTQAKDDPIEYIHNEIGYNYRLTNIQAAMGCAQLEVLDDFIAAKRRVADTYFLALKDVSGINCLREAPWAFSIWWMYTVFIDPQVYGMDSRALLRTFDDAGIQSRPLWHPIHLNKAYANCRAYHCSVAEYINRHALSLPSSVGLTPAQQQRVIDLVKARRAKTQGMALG